MKNFDIGGVQFDVATVAAVESCSPEVMEDEANPSRITCTGGSGTGDKGNYAVTSKIHNMKLGPLNTGSTPTMALTPRPSRAMTV